MKLALNASPSEAYTPWSSSPTVTRKGSSCSTAALVALMAASMCRWAALRSDLRDPTMSPNNATDEEKT